MEEDLSVFSRTKVADEQYKHDDVLQNEKDRKLLEGKNSLKTMFEEMTSLKSRLLFKEEEVEILKGIVALKDEEIDILKEKLLVRDLKVDYLRDNIELAWRKFDTFETIRSPERPENEIKHEKEPREEIKGMAQKQDEIPFNSISLPLIHGEAPSPFATLIGPPLHSYVSTEEADIVGAGMSFGPPLLSYVSMEEAGIVGAGMSFGPDNSDF